VRFKAGDSVKRNYEDVTIAGADLDRLESWYDAQRAR
jgi:hypothetical protein